MLFNSTSFLVFLLLFYVPYFLSRKNTRLQNIIVLAGSYIFYGWWDERFLILIAVSTVTDYVAAFGASGRRIPLSVVTKSMSFLALVGAILFSISGFTEYLLIVGTIAYIVIGCIIVLALESAPEKNRRKLYLTWSIVANLAMLGFFKYYNFFVTSLIDSAQLFGLSLDLGTLSVVLPVGISFYTFQTLSYTIDAYRKELEPTEDFISHAAFVAFFPQLVAGPIERAKNLLPQFFSSRTISIVDLKVAATLFFWGLYKKVVIADNLSPISDRVFENPSIYGAGDLLVGVLAFTFQIYCDFSGYSDMARGLARSMGFKLMLNFDLPYFSRTPSEFWRRWHISLSTWLRDYLYISLGGNKLGRFLTYRNLLLTMLLGGLWHGAAWNFIAWGAFHGLLLVAYRLLGADRLLSTASQVGVKSIALNATFWLIMSIWTMIGWILFRIESLSDFAIFAKGFVYSTAWSSDQWSIVLVLICPLLLVQILQKFKNELNVIKVLPKFVSANLILFVMLSLFLLAARGGQEFIYFDF